MRHGWRGWKRQRAVRSPWRVERRTNTGGGGGGATPRFWTPTTHPTNCRPEAPLGGGRWEGGVLGGAPGRAVPGGGGCRAKSEVVHKWARWLHNPCCLGGPHRFRAGGKIRSGPQVGKVATSSLPPGGVPTALERGAESEVAHKWARWLHHPCCPGVPTASERGAKLEVAHKWARWLHKHCRLAGPQHFRARGKTVGKVAT